MSTLQIRQTLAQLGIEGRTSASFLWNSALPTPYLSERSSQCCLGGLLALSPTEYIEHVRYMRRYVDQHFDDALSITVMFVLGVTKYVGLQ